MKSNFQTISDKLGKQLWLIEQLPISEHQKENKRRTLNNMKPLTKKQYLEQERYYR